VKGTVVTWNEAQKIGFIRPDGESLSDIVVHSSEVKGNRPLPPGTLVHFTLGPAALPGTYQAQDVRPMQCRPCAIGDSVEAT